jgi:hypothetical protein
MDSIKQVIAKTKIRSTLFMLFGILMFSAVFGQESKGKLAEKPVFTDPVYDGAADPVIVWNKKEKKWFMFYTNRRATDMTLDGVKWVHGTRIGIAESTDGGASWKYRDTANIKFRPTAEYTHWAPDVFEHKGLYHMFLTYVPGIFNNWNHPREIVHLTSKDLLNWDYKSTVKLVSDHVIDPTVYQLPDGTWRLWYNNEADAKSIYYADSKDLENWNLKEKVIKERGEGPKVFRWKGKYWMLVDNWAGMSFYFSDDATHWTKQPERILELPGKGKEDQAIGGHADVVVSGERAFVYYFTHPGRIKKPFADKVETRRSVIQVAELEYNNGAISVDRDKPVYLQLDKQALNNRQ